MFDNQLDFSDPNRNGFIFSNLDEKNNHHSSCFEDLQARQIQNYILNNEHYQAIAVPEMKEQLDYKVQSNTNVLPMSTPNPVYYEATHKSTVSIRKKTKTIPKKKVFPIRKNKRNLNTNKERLHSQPEPNNFTSQVNNKGLFDPKLKKNELDYPRKTQLQRMEREEKIKSYDVKFGNKVKKFQMYGNYVDLLEDVENKKAEREFSKNNGKVLKSKNIKELELALNIPPPKIKPSTNLDFNFSHYDQMIKALEDQIGQERKLRTEINMKYLEKMKEYEELRFNQQGANKTKSNPSLSSKQARKTNKLIKNYSTNKSKVNKSQTYKSHLNRTIKSIRRSISPPKKKIFPEDIIKIKARALAKSAEKVIDKTFNSIYKTITKRNNGRIKNEYNVRVENNNQLPVSNEQPDNFSANEENKSQLNFFSQPENVNYSTNCVNMQSPANIQSNFNNLNPHSSTTQLQGNYATNLNEQTKLNMLDSLNKEVDFYCKGIPKLMNKVEETIVKINKTNIFNEHTHPIIKMASKTSGQIVQLHVEEIVEKILDELLMENVEVLQVIEEENKQRIEKENFSKFVSQYYSNFKELESIEEDISRKIENINLSKVYVPYKRNVVASAQSKVDNVIYYNPFQTQIDPIKALETKANPTECVDVFTLPSDEHINNFLLNHKTRYRINLPRQLLYSVEKYSKSFYEYLKVTGAFYYPNVFEIYDKFVIKMTDILLEEQIEVCLKQVDNFVTDLYKEEVFTAGKNGNPI